MKTRISKIARLPLQIREQLNQRLLNGEIGAPLLRWLNELPQTREILAELFVGKAITKQNLSEWRHSGYQDWLRHWHRQERFQQMNEQGEELEGNEGSEDLFENFSRLVLAEMAEDFNDLPKITNRTERWKRLREISRDLARLQHSYNHSRKVALSFAKWNHKTGAVGQSNGQEEKEALKSAPSAQNPEPVAPSPTESNQKNSAAVLPITRIIYHRQCGFGCICKNCHPDDGEYPYAQAVKDYEHHKDPAYCRQENALIFNGDCDCYCGCAKSIAWEQRTPGQFPYAISANHARVP